MPFHRESYLHELGLIDIVRILKSEAFQIPVQALTSAVTNTCEQDNSNLPVIDDNTEGVRAFSDIQFAPTVSRVLDVGGGKFDGNRRYLSTKNIMLLVWDPFNRTVTENAKVAANVTEHKVDAATSMSVLNVIPECNARLMHINTLKQAVVVGGKCYFKVWSGEGLLKGSSLPVAENGSFQANAYAARFLHEVQLVFGKKHAWLDPNIPNLIVAQNVKSTISYKSIQRMAMIAEWIAQINRYLKLAAERKIYAKENIRLLSYGIFVNRKKQKNEMPENHAQKAAVKCYLAVI